MRHEEHEDTNGEEENNCTTAHFSLRKFLNLWNLVEPEQGRFLVFYTSNAPTHVIDRCEDPSMRSQ
jgi:hypothetical protein